MLDFIGDGLFLRGIGRRRRGFNPASLFAGTVQGVFFDPSDRTTLYQDAAGTTPANQPGHPVGLMLDKSKGLVLGPELVTNGDFSAGSVGWVVTGTDATHIATFVNGKLHYQSDTTSPQLAVAQDGILVIGKTYRITIETSARGSGSLKTDSFGTLVLSSAVGTTVFMGVATSNKFSITRNTTDVDITVDSVSVRELPGYHATQPVAASRPTLARHPKTGRRNLLTQTNDFSHADWVKSGVLLTADNVVAPDGTPTADTIIPSTTNTFAAVREVLSLALNATYTLSLYVKAGTSARSWFSLYDPTAAVHKGYIIFDWVNGVPVTQSVQSASNVSYTAVGNGWYRVSFTTTSDPANASHYTIFYPDRVNGTGSVSVWGAQLEAGPLTPYQRVTTAYDVTEAGVEDLWYLAFDGVDDMLMTPVLDLTATDKVGIFAGVRKLSDAASGVVAEFGSGVAVGTFALFAPLSSSSYSLRSSRSTLLSAGLSNLPAPHGAVLTGLIDIAGDVISLRANGAAPVVTTTDQETGNFLSGALSLGRRNGTNVLFTGNLYGLIVAGKMPTAAEIANTEAYLNGKTGAYAA